MRKGKKVKIKQKMRNWMGKGGKRGWKGVPRPHVGLKTTKFNIRTWVAFWLPCLTIRLR